MAGFKLWKSYTRKQIAEYWNYSSGNALWRGVVTRKHVGGIWLFVTRENQKSLTQYNNSIYDNVLLWEGEKGHQKDRRIVNTRVSGEKIFLFFRTRARQEFIYFGRVHLLNYKLEPQKPSRFVFEIEALTPQVETRTDTTMSSAVTDLGPTNRTVLRTERVGQTKWRRQLLQLWGQSCSVTLLQKERLLRASHIKPWQHCSDKDRLYQHNGLILNPSLDCLFDCGFITFQHNGGHIKISDILSEQDRKILGVCIEMSLRKTFSENKEYLEYHNDCVFEKWMKANALQQTLQL